MINRRVVIVLIVVLSIVLFMFYLFTMKRHIHTLGNATRIIKQIDILISTYIKENQGNFPESEEELEFKGYIRKIKTKNGFEYRMRPTIFDSRFRESQEKWMRIWDFELFRLYYGVKVGDINVINGKLYNKNVKEQILLLDGPYSRNLKQLYYETVSMQWYQLMLLEQQKLQDKSYEEASD